LFVRAELKTPRRKVTSKTAKKWEQATKKRVQTKLES
jgi:hypothetical protein